MQNVSQKIMLLEDNEELGSLQTEILLSHHYEVVWCKNIKEFNEKIDPSFLLIISDIELPDGSGIQNFKKNRHLYSSPTIFQTGKHDDAQTIVEALKFGALNFLKKPFSMADVTLIIQQYELIKLFESKNIKIHEKAKRSFGMMNS